MSDLAKVDTARVGTTAVVRVIGELDLSNARAVTDGVSHSVPEQVTLAVLDLTGTTFLDSAAVASLFRLAERLRDRRQELRLVVPRAAPIRAVIELTRLSQVVPVDEGPPDLLDTARAYAALPPSPGQAAP
ncbi:STAS domain-containing protein [Terrabacter sp. NPDC080008]|uniref:STAS domain-containing protein n=1 Tax=Terrabacter sp. NPDC080008 TaxID=3155176 RepID=UPI00344E1CF6